MEYNYINNIYHRDCMDVLCDLDDESVDLTILDPNYNDWDKLLEDGLMCQVVRVTKQTGNIVCFTKQPFDFNLRNEINHIFRREIVWTFENGGAWVSNKMPLVSFQKIYWCVVSNNFYFQPHTGLDYSENIKAFKRKNKVFGGYNAAGKDYTPSDEGTWMRDHYHYNKPNYGKIPAKPLDLLTILIRCFTPPNGIVLDPFAGSGMGCVAAIREKRNFIGFEIDEDNFKIAQDNINKQLIQPTLF